MNIPRVGCLVRDREDGALMESKRETEVEVTEVRLSSVTLENEPVDIMS